MLCNVHVADDLTELVCHKKAVATPSLSWFSKASAFLIAEIAVGTTAVVFAVAHSWKRYQHSRRTRASEDLHFPSRESVVHKAKARCCRRKVAGKEK